MEKMTSITTKQLYLILIPSAVLIFSLSLETLLTVKDAAVFEEWLARADLNGKEQLSSQEAFETFVVAHLSSYVFKIIVPVALSIHSYLAYKKLQINTLFVLLWTVLVGGSFLFNLIEWDFESLFYYLNLGVHIVLIFSIVSLFQFTNFRREHH